MKNAVKEAMALAKTMTVAEVQDVWIRLAKVREQLAKARKLLNSLSALEAGMKQACTDAVQKLEKEKDRLSAALIFGHYPCIGLEPLKWRTEEGWPALAPFPVNGQSVVFTNLDDGWGNARIRATEALKPFSKLYTDVFENLAKKRAQRRSEISITATFTGVIPQSTKDKITEASSEFKEQIFVLAEVEAWKLNEVVIPQRDPLVVGYAEENLWLIDQFDLTPLEEYVKREFAV